MRWWRQEIKIESGLTDSFSTPVKDSVLSAANVFIKVSIIIISCDFKFFKSIVKCVNKLHRLDTNLLRYHPDDGRVQRKKKSSQKNKNKIERRLNIRFKQEKLLE